MKLHSYIVIPPAGWFTHKLSIIVFSCKAPCQASFRPLSLGLKCGQSGARPSSSRGYLAIGTRTAGRVGCSLGKPPPFHWIMQEMIHEALKRGGRDLGSDWPKSKSTCNQLSHWNDSISTASSCFITWLALHWQIDPIPASRSDKILLMRSRLGTSMGRALIAHPTDMPGIIQDAGEVYGSLSCAGFYPRSFHSVPPTVLWMAQTWRHGGLSVS